MRPQRFVSYVLLAIAAGAFGVVAYAWHVLVDSGSLLEQAGAFRDPQFQFKSVADYEHYLWVHLGLWLVLGVVSLMTGVGLLAAQTKSWGWGVAFAGAALFLVHYGVVLAVRPVLWVEFLGAIGGSLAVVACYYEARKATRNAF